MDWKMNSKCDQSDSFGVLRGIRYRFVMVSVQSCLLINIREAG